MSDSEQANDPTSGRNEFPPSHDGQPDHDVNGSEDQGQNDSPSLEDSQTSGREDPWGTFPFRKRAGLERRSPRSSDMYERIRRNREHTDSE